MEVNIPWAACIEGSQQQFKVLKLLPQLLQLPHQLGLYLVNPKATEDFMQANHEAWGYITSKHSYQYIS